MSDSHIVHCKKLPYDYYIGRPGKFGNPWTIGKDGTREEVIQLFEYWIKLEEQASLREEIKKELRGKILGCWCDFDKGVDCHGRILLEIAENG